MDKFDEAMVERLGKAYVQVGREDLYKRQYPEIYAEGYRPWELPSYTIPDAEWQSVYAGIRAVLAALSETHAIVAKENSRTERGMLRAAGVLAHSKDCCCPAKLKDPYTPVCYLDQFVVKDMCFCDGDRRMVCWEDWISGKEDWISGKEASPDAR